MGSPLPSYGDPEKIYAFAAGATNYALEYIAQLIATSAGMTPPTITPVFPTIPTPPAPVTVPFPTFQPITWTMPNAPASFTDTLDISGLLPEPFDGTPPTLAFPGAPSAFTETTPDAPGISLTFDYPTLSVTLPAPPDLLKLNIEQFDGVTMPSVPADADALTAYAPSVVDYVPGASYTSSLLTAVQAKLQQQITDGTDTGLPAEVETALWDRAREREFRAARDSLDALDQMEALGYSMPPGAFLDARTKILTETEASTVGLSREIMIKQAELHLENVTKATANAISLESMLVGYINQIEQRNFDSCKYATEAGISIYNAQVQAYAAYIEAYKTKVSIYEAQIRAEISKVEAYKAQVEAEHTKAEANTALVQQYDTLVRAALTNVDIYKAELAAIQTKAEIEKTKVEVYGEQIKAYVGRINAYTANVEGFKAAISAEGAKQEAYRSSVMAYTAEVEAGVKTAEARIEEYKGELQAKALEWDGYKSLVSAQSSQAQAIASINQTTSESYKAEISATASYNELLTKQWQVALDESERIAEVGVQAAKMNAELYISQRTLAAEGARVGSQVMAQLGAAALNAIHWSSSVSTGSSISDSSSVSTSISTSTNTNYSL
jgi:phage shock protein A